MTISEFFKAGAERGKAQKVTIEVTDTLNEDYTRKQRFTGVPILFEFKLPDSRATVDAYITKDQMLAIVTNDQERTGLEMFASVEEFLDSDAPENLKSAIASELDVDYVEELDAPF